MKKVFSIITLVFTVGITVAPFIPKSTCPESCCRITAVEEMEANGCEMSVGQCNYPVFLPLVAVQLDHHHGPADGYLSQTVMIEPLNDELYFVPTYVLNVDADAPPGHLTPLRV